MCNEYFTCVRNIRETLNLNRNGGACCLNTITMFVSHCTNLTEGRASGNCIAYMKGTLLYKNGCNRATALIELCFDYKTSSLTLRISLKFHNFCSQKDHIQKVINTFMGLSGYRCEYSASTPIFRDQIILRKFLLNTVDVGIGLIDLIYSNDNLNTCSLSMVDRFNRLRHYTIICSNNKDCDIGGLSTTHTHCSEGFMSGSI